VAKQEIPINERKIHYESFTGGETSRFNKLITTQTTILPSEQVSVLYHTTRLPYLYFLSCQQVNINGFIFFFFSFFF
jgi:hypothetical protein